MAALEAMASGRPVVGTAVGGLCEVMPDGVAGVIVDPRDDDAIAAGRATITNIATARELPTDVVVHLDVTTPDTVADAITGLLNDDTRRDTIRRHAARHAASWTFERLADHLLEIVASLPPQPGP